MPELLHHLQSYPLPALHYLRVECGDVSDVRALTAFLPHCTNLRTLGYERKLLVSESVEKEMWEAAVRTCRDLEALEVGAEDSDISCDRLKSVLRRLSEREGIQALKLRRIVGVDWSRPTGAEKEDYTEHVKHLLPALQQ